MKSTCACIVHLRILETSSAVTVDQFGIRDGLHKTSFFVVYCEVYLYLYGVRSNKELFS